MANKVDFSNEEWWQLSEAPLAVAMYVSGADTRTGPVGTIKELSAPFKAAATAKETAPTGSLFSELLDTWSTKLSDDSKKDAEASVSSGVKPGTDLLAFIKGVGSLLDAKASPADAKAVKEWLASAARLTAEAGKEGAMLGIGGERVSGAESKALAEVGLALGVTI